MNRWAHFIAMLEDIDSAARLRPLEGKATVCRQVSFRSHLGEGYYINAIYRKCFLDFRIHCGWKINTIYASSSGITINLMSQFVESRHSGYTRALPQICQHSAAMWMYQQRRTPTGMKGLHGLLSVWRRQRFGGQRLCLTNEKGCCMYLNI